MIIDVFKLYESGIPVADINLKMIKKYPRHNKKNLEIHIEKSIEMLESLNQSVNEAKGGRFDLSRLEEMSIFSLISILGVNNIRFMFTKSKDVQVLKTIKEHAQEQFDGFKKQLEEESNNIVAAVGMDIYKGIIKILEFKNV